MYFDKEIIILNSDATNQEQALKELSNAMFNKKIVKDDFFKNIMEREKNYPTGLLVNGVGIAIPHTDSEYVNQSQLGFMSLKNPVIFNEMGTFDNEIEVELIFMLALKEAHEQLSMLQRLIEIFQNQVVVSKLLDIRSDKSFIELMDEQNLK